MPLSAGTQLGPYEIIALLGAGGMGEVHRARDTKLNRDVAVKILPDAFADDPDRLQRFTREAQTLAALNHPNVAHIYGLERLEGRQNREPMAFIVMELVEGEDLAQRVARGAIPLVDALPIAKQIAEALAAAHEQGIVHRDLKPANIKVREDGTVKVLDFGLAKALEAGGAGATGGAGRAVGLTHSPTMLNASMPGMILGTAAYMSPEQAKGRPVDRRTDIFAFGCVLFEMLTGRPAFEGDDVAEILSRVLQREPDWTLLPANVPPRISELLRLCLEKNAKQRRSDAGDVRLDLEQAMRPSEAAPIVAAQSARRAWPAAILAVVALLAIGVLAGRAIPRGSPSPSRPVWMSLLPPPYGFASEVNPAVSPDGRTIAFVGLGAKGETQLWLRALESPTLRNIPGSEGAAQPFWSPDGQWIGFFAQGKLKKAPVSGGSPQVLADAPLPRGATWNTRGDILFSPISFEPIYRTTAGGGAAAPLASLVPPAGQVQERQSFPQFLPDGRHFLFSRGLVVAVGTLDSSEVKEIAPIASKAEYANGHLFFVRDGDLFAQPFDVDRLALNGEPTKIADNIGWTGQIPTHFAFSTSTNGVVAFWDRSAFETSQLTWLDRAGNKLGVLGEPGEFDGLALSPDARHVAVEMHEPKGGRVSVWLIDVATGVRSRFTSYANWTALPMWSADSSRMLVTDFSEQLHILPLAGGSPQEISVGRGAKWPSDWSRDGRFVVYWEGRETRDIGIVTTDGRAPGAYLQTPFNEWHGQISPDGSWLAYLSDESGSTEVYVQSFPKIGRKVRISTSGANDPVWRPDGRALFYLAANGDLVEAELSVTTGGLELHNARVLFRPPVPALMYGRTQFAITTDGRRFLFNVVVPDVSPKAVTVVLNWNPSAK